MADVGVEVTSGVASFDARLPLDPMLTIGDAVATAARIATVPVQTVTAWRVSRTGHLIAIATSMSDVDLLEGDRLEAVADPLTPGSSEVVAPDATVVVEVVRGSAGGAIARVGPGTHTIGRSDANTISIGHESVSRQHAQLNVEKNRITVHDTKSANGTVVDGAPVVGTQEIGQGAVVEVGDAVLAVSDLARTPPHLTRTGPVVVCNRPPRVLGRNLQQTFTFPRVPQKVVKRPIPVLTMIIPLLLAGVMAIVISPLYLLLGLASPLLMFANLAEDRRSGRRRAREEAVSWERGVAEVRDAVAHAHRSATFERRARHPIATLAGARVLSRSSTVWEVRPNHADFLQTCAGVGTLPSVITVQVPDQGDDHFRAQAQEIADGVSFDNDVPFVLDLVKLGTVGIAANEQQRHAITRAQLVQLTARHAPQDLQCVVLAPLRAAAWDWTKWLPHARVDGEIAVASDEGRADALFHAVLELAEARVEARTGSLGAPTSLPHIVVVIEPPIPVAPRDAARLCELATSASMSVFWLAEDPEQVPNAARAVVSPTNAVDEPDELGQLSGSVLLPEQGTRQSELRLDTLSECDARRFARALAPWRNNVGADDRTGVPTRVDLFELFEVADLTSDTVVERWRSGGFGTDAVLGRGLRGASIVDLRADGPHALVAGTTGAGKSELLQTWVAALAFSHPPTRLTFVLIDYKGGAAFKDCVDLPHTVGFVTDLDAAEAARATVSLNAEVTRREHILAAHGAKDLMELEARDPTNAPPVLVLIVDEFAALKAEIPEFVSALVDIAQRGRSLGIHLILATQKPGGTIDPKIQANTNLRIALRMANAGESQDVLGRPLAASISRRTPGRAFVRIGETQLFEMQSGFAGATAESDSAEEASTPSLFSIAGSHARSGSQPFANPKTFRSQLQVLVASSAAAARALQLAPPARPWCAPLPLLISTHALREHTPSPAADTTSTTSLSAVVGLADEPARQTQGPFELNLTADGNIAVYGGPGSGKTTLLRTIAVQLASTLDPDRLHMYGLDFASRGLVPLEKLPQCGGVVTGDQLDRVRRLIDIVATEMTNRQEQMASLGAGTIAELERSTERVLPRIVVFIDGFASFWQTMEPLDRSEHVNRLLRVAADGRGVGIHLVYSADRRAAVTPALSSVTGARVVLNMPSFEEYASLGLPHLARQHVVLPPGRFVVREGLDVQTAVISANGHDGVAQTEALADLANHISRTHPHSSVPPVRELPAQVRREDIGKRSDTIHGRRSALLGIDDQRRDGVYLDFTTNPLFFVVGPEQSGRTTTLETLTKSLVESTPGVETHFVSARRSALADSDFWTTATTGPSATDRLAELRAHIDQRADVVDASRNVVVIVIDDGDEFVEGLGPTQLEVVVKRARDADTIVLASMTSFKAARAFCQWVPFLRNNRHGLLLQPGEDDGELFGTRLPKRTGLALPPGRGYLFERSVPRLVQVALP